MTRTTMSARLAAHETGAEERHQTDTDILARGQVERPPDADAVAAPGTTRRRAVPGRGVRS